MFPVAIAETASIRHYDMWWGNLQMTARRVPNCLGGGVAGVFGGFAAVHRFDHHDLPHVEGSHVDVIQHGVEHHRG
jgi:hypothetical protein